MPFQTKIKPLYFIFFLLYEIDGDRLRLLDQIDRHSVQPLEELFLLRVKCFVEAEQNLVVENVPLNICLQIHSHQSQGCRSNLFAFLPLFFDFQLLVNRVVVFGGVETETQRFA